MYNCNSRVPEDKKVPNIISTQLIKGSETTFLTILCFTWLVNWWEYIPQVWEMSVEKDPTMKLTTQWHFQNVQTLESEGKILTQLKLTVLALTLRKMGFHCKSYFMQCLLVSKAQSCSIWKKNESVFISRVILKTLFCSVIANGSV